MSSEQFKKRFRNKISTLGKRGRLITSPQNAIEKSDSAQSHYYLTRNLPKLDFLTPSRREIHELKELRSTSNRYSQKKSDRYANETNRRFLSPHEHISTYLRVLDNPTSSHKQKAHQTVSQSHKSILKSKRILPVVQNRKYLQLDLNKVYSFNHIL